MTLMELILNVKPSGNRARTKAEIMRILNKYRVKNSKYV